MKKHTQKNSLTFTQKTSLIFGVWIFFATMALAQNHSQYDLELTLLSQNNTETCQINFKKLNPNGTILWQKITELNSEHTQDNPLLLNLHTDPNYWKNGAKLSIECEHTTESTLKIILLKDGYDELSTLRLSINKNTHKKEGIWKNPKNKQLYKGPLFSIVWTVERE